MRILAAVPKGGTRLAQQAPPPGLIFSWIAFWKRLTKVQRYTLISLLGLLLLGEFIWLRSLDRPPELTPLDPAILAQQQRIQDRLSPAATARLELVVSSVEHRLLRWDPLTDPVEAARSAVQVHFPQLEPSAQLTLVFAVLSRTLQDLEQDRLLIQTARADNAQLYLDLQAYQERLKKQAALWGIDSRPAVSTKRVVPAPLDQQTPHFKLEYLRYPTGPLPEVTALTRQQLRAELDLVSARLTALTETARHNNLLLAAVKPSRARLLQYLTEQVQTVEAFPEASLRRI